MSRKTENKLEQLARFCKKKKLQLYPISAVTGEGIENLKRAVFEKLSGGMLKVGV